MVDHLLQQFFVASDNLVLHRTFDTAYRIKVFAADSGIGYLALGTQASESTLADMEVLAYRISVHPHFVEIFGAFSGFAHEPFDVVYFLRQLFESI